MQVVYKELPSKRRFGVELEVSATISKYTIGDLLTSYEENLGSGRDVVVTPGIKGWSETRQNKYWHVKYDSTCGPKGKGKDHGWEVASYIGKGYRDLTRIVSLADYLRCSGVETNRNCGLHIHVEAKDLTPHHMGVLMARWLKLEPLLVSVCDPYRSGNKYCKSLRQRWELIRWQGYLPQLPQQFWRDMSPRDFHTHNNEEKKYTLNTVGWAIGQVFKSHDRQTIELRLPECILSTEHVLNWTRLMLNFIEGCKDATAPEDLTVAPTIRSVLELLNLQGSGDFYLLDKKLLDTKLWFLRKVCETSHLDYTLLGDAHEMVEFITDI